MSDLDVKEFEHALVDLALWWEKYAQDSEFGGFYGRVLYDNTAVADADKSIILQARATWFFSALAIHEKEDQRWLALAKHGYEFLLKYFWDSKNGGFVWMVDARGATIDSRKHLYAQAFGIYAFSAYSQAVSAQSNPSQSSANQEPLNYALKAFELIEKYGRDRQAGGYWEAFTADWSALKDVRLSEKENNFPKTMNTHLHLLEAYTELDKALQGQNKKVNSAISDLLVVYCERFVDLDSGHTRMFLQADWEDCSSFYSYGHDIESSWLLSKALSRVSDKTALELVVNTASTLLAQTSLLDGMNNKGFLNDECNKLNNDLSPAAWWVQVEAMVGFIWAWKHNQDKRYYEAVMRIWHYLEGNYRDVKRGEWYWFPTHYIKPENTEYKTGEWKGPYHTGRALMELISILK